MQFFCTHKFTRGHILRGVGGLFCQWWSYPNKEFIEAFTDQLFISSKWTILEFESAFTEFDLFLFMMPFIIFQVVFKLLLLLFNKSV